MSNCMNPVDGSLILLVEDHVPLRRNLAFLLKVAGFDVAEASDGAQSLEVLRDCTPDLILSDVDMPNMNGYELLRAVRSHREWASVPVIFMSDKYGMDDLLYALDLGANDYVPKPYDIYDVLDAIQRTLPQPVLERDLRQTAS